MQVIPIHDSGKWNRFVAACPEACYTHLYGWRDVIGKVYGHRSVYLAAVRKSKICGVLPLFRIKPPFGRPHWVSIPFFDRAGLLGDADAGELLLKKAADLEPKSRGSLSLRQDSRYSFSDQKLGGKPPYCYTEKIDMQIPLAPSRQEMLARFRSKLRSQINKGIKNGLRWEIGKQRLVAPFYTVFSRNMRDLGSPVHSKRFFNAIFERFSAHAFICVIYLGNRPAAAALMFRFKNRLANPWASSLREFRHLNTNMLLYWQMIGFACNLGMETFDMGRSSKGAPTHRFKQQWGPVEIPLTWYTWAFGGKKTGGETLAIPPWKRLPVCAANLTGPMIRKYISL